MTERVFEVTGMTCAHCVSSITEEVGKVPGVQAVNVELSDGVLTVAGDDVSPDAVRSAVEEAGYEVVATP